MEARNENYGVVNPCWPSLGFMGCFEVQGVKGEKMEVLKKETPLEKARKARGKKTRMKLSRGQAMTLFCLECMGYDGHRNNGTGTISRTKAAFEVTKCTDPECPLFEWRNKKVRLSIKKV